MMAAIEREESSTVGASVVSLSSSPVAGSDSLTAITEESLETGTEKGIACKYCSLINGVM